MLWVSLWLLTVSRSLLQSKIIFAAHCADLTHEICLNRESSPSVTPAGTLSYISAAGGLGCGMFSEGYFCTVTIAFWERVAPTKIVFRVWSTTLMGTTFRDWKLQ